eukprot:29428_1
MSEISDYTQYIPELAIIQLIFSILSIVSYAYGIKKWIQLETHFMIRQRFPTISKLIVMLSFIGSTLKTIERWIQFHNNNALYVPKNKHAIEYMLWITIIQSSGRSLSFFVYGLINQRLLLIYLRWKRHQMSISDVQKHVFKKHNNIYYNLFCRAIFVFTLIGALYMTLCCLFGDMYIDNEIIIINSVFWILMLMINIILIFIIICKKVKDGIGCLTETVIMLCYLLVNTIFPPLAYTNDSLVFPCYLMLSFLPFFEGFFPLFIPLYYIYRLEGTLNIYKIKQNNKKRILFHIKNKLYSLNSITSVKVPTHTPQTPQTPQINYEMGFFEFIKEYKNYKIFCKYLSYSWAIENILFLERVSIIYEIIIKHKNMNGIEHKSITKYTENMNPYQQTVEIQEKFVMQPLEFEYLKEIYSEYETIISEHIIHSNGANKYDLEYLHKPLAIIYKHIYNEFIADLSSNQINISSQTKSHLSYILDGNINKLETVDDFLHLFNDAKEEIGGLLISMYDYKFKEFVKKKHIANDILND